VVGNALLANIRTSPGAERVTIYAPAVGHYMNLDLRVKREAHRQRALFSVASIVASIVRCLAFLDGENRSPSSYERRFGVASPTQK